MRIKFWEPTGPYDGPRCFVPFDHDGPDKKRLKGGWHYSTRQHKKYGEIPNRKLHLNEENRKLPPFYEYAEKHHESWVQKHGVGNIVAIQGVTEESENT